MKVGMFTYCLAIPKNYSKASGVVSHQAILNRSNKQDEFIGKRADGTAVSFY